MDSNKQSKGDLSNSRRNTIENNPPHDDKRSSYDIDKKITDLEDLISHLQDEITEMSITLGKSSSYKAKQTDPKQIFINEFDNRELPANNSLLVKDLTLDHPGLSDNVNNLEDNEDDHNFGFKTIRDQFASLWNNGFYDEIDDSQEFKDNIKDILTNSNEHLTLTQDRIDGPSKHDYKKSTE